MQETATPTLRQLAAGAGVQVGVALATDPLRDDPRYRSLVAQEFDLVVAENAMKFEQTQRRPGEFTFGDADEIVAFAEGHATAVRGHALLWHRMLPGWAAQRLEAGGPHANALLDGHVAAVAGRYAGRVDAWDVVNEPLGRGQRLRNSPWRRGLGPEYVERALRAAHEADPQAALFVNEWGAETPGRKADGLFALCRRLLERSAPLHGVGFQMHLAARGRRPRRSDGLRRNLERFAALGLTIHVTEMDVQCRRVPGTHEDRLAAQADVYRGALEAVLRYPPSGRSSSGASRTRTRGSPCTPGKRTSRCSSARTTGPNRPTTPSALRSRPPDGGPSAGSRAHLDRRRRTTARPGARRAARRPPRRELGGAHDATPPEARLVHAAW